jgi:hypothetical protein
MSKKYTTIVKIKDNVDGTAHCLKYRVNDLLSFTKFLDTNWPNWKWYNVYSNELENKRVQLANFTKNNRPKSKSL